MATMAEIGSLMQRIRDTETTTVAAAGLRRGGTLAQYARGELPKEAWLYTNVGGPRMEPIGYLRADYWVVVASGYASYCCHADTPVYIRA